MRVSWQSTGDAGPPIRRAALELREPTVSTNGSRSEANHGLSRGLERWTDLGLDLPVRDDTTFLLPAAALQQKNGPGVEGIAAGPERSAAGSARTIDSPIVELVDSSPVELASTSDVDVPARTAAIRAANMMADPSITLTPQTNFVPVNANHTNMTMLPWKTHTDGTPIVGFPKIRDFDLNPMRNLNGWNGMMPPPPGPAIPDPELKKMTATVANGNPSMMNVYVIYSDADNNGGGLVRLWLDQSKTTAINLTHIGFGVNVGILPTFPTTEFWVEGIRPSKTVNDVKIKVTYTPVMPPAVMDEEMITVTPVVSEFSVNPVLPQVTFLRQAGGTIVGLNSGRQSMNGALPGTGDYGAVFTADLNKTGIDGKGAFIHNVTNVLNGAPSGVEMADGTRFNLLLNGALTYPISDSPTAAVVPLHTGPDPKTGVTAPHDVVLNATRHQFWSPDVPAFGHPVPGTTLARWDMTFQAQLSLMWKFADDTLYTLAQVNWQVVFRADQFFGVLVIAANSVVSASPMVLTHGDPARVVGPVFNDSFSIR